MEGRGRVLAVLTAALCAGGPLSAQQTPGALEVAMELAQGPGNLTITPAGRRILSLHQFFAPPRPLAEALGMGELYAYPRPDSLLPPMPAVLGMRSDTAGVLYILDNGEQGKRPPKLVLWDSRTERLQRSIDLRAVTDTNSWINDLAFDYRRNQVYISDPAGGSNAALVVVDLASGRARRVLVGHPSVQPENIEFMVEGKPLRRRRPDGTLEFPRTGVDGIAIDPAQEWVYYGALTGRTLYRIRAADLANASAGPQQLASRVERFSDKPPSDGMLFDQAGNLYLGDLPNNAIGVITPDRRYRELARDPRLSWVDDFAFGPDGTLYVVATQLHLAPQMNAGIDASRPPWRVFRMRPLAPQRPGR